MNVYNSHVVCDHLSICLLLAYCITHQNYALIPALQVELVFAQNWIMVLQLRLRVMVWFAYTLIAVAGDLDFSKGKN